MSSQLRPFFSIQNVNFLWEIYSQVIWNLLFEVLIGNFKSDVKFLIWMFFFNSWFPVKHWNKHLKLKFGKKSNQWRENKIMLNWFDLKFTVGPYMIYFCCLWCKIILTAEFSCGKERGPYFPLKFTRYFF